MPRINRVCAAPLWISWALLAASAPALAGRTIQGGVVLDGVPPIDEAISLAVPRYAAVGEARLLDWLSDGALLIAERTEFRDQMERLRAAAGKSAAPIMSEALGAPDYTLRAAGAQMYRSETLAVLRDETAAVGAAGAALYLQPLNGGEARLLASAAAHPGMPVWAHDGRRLAFSAMLREEQTIDLYVLDTAAASEPRLVAAGSAASWEVLDWTRSDRALLVRHPVSASGDELLMVDVETGALHRVDGPEIRPARAPGYGHIGEARLSPDGRGVYLITDRDSRVAQLRYIDFYGAPTQVLSLPVNHDIEHFDVSADGRYLAYSWSEGGYGRVTVIDRKAALESAPAELPTGVIAALKFERGGARLALEIAPSAAPRGVYVYEPASGALARWTHAELGALGAAQLVTPQTIRFATWDRPGGSARTLAALLYRPRSAGKHPVLVLLGDTARGTVPLPQLDLFVQYCVNELGLTVVAPALRAGEAGPLDLGALLAWLGAQPDLQHEPVLLLGRGAGGSLALAALGLYSDRLRGAISIDGSASGTQLAAIRAPVLLVRGMLDPPLSAGAAEQLLWRLRSANIRSWFIAPRDSGGRLTGGADLDTLRGVIAQFLVSNLGG